MPACRVRLDGDEEEDDGGGDDDQFNFKLPLIVTDVV